MEKQKEIKGAKKKREGPMREKDAENNKVSPLREKYAQKKNNKGPIREIERDKRSESLYMRERKVRRGIYERKSLIILQYIEVYMMLTDLNNYLPSSIVSLL